MIKDINHPLHRDLVAATNILFAKVHEKKFGFHPVRPGQCPSHCQLHSSSLDLTVGQSVQSNEELTGLP